MIKKRLKLLSAASFSEGVAALTWLALIPSEGGSFSLPRLGLMFGVSFFSLGWLLVYLQKPRILRAVHSLLNSKGKRQLATLCICLPLWLLSATTHRDLWSLHLSETQFARLLPVLLLVILVSIQFGVFVVLAEADSKNDSPPWKGAAILLCCFLLIGLFVAATNIGTTTDAVGLSWGPPGTPVTFGQITLAFAASMSIMVPLWLLFAEGLRRRWVDVLLFTGLWILAVFLWSREPMIPSHFASAPMQPNFEYYPNSDAAVFDRSVYHLLYGAGFNTQLIRRPFYVGLLALYHAIAGPGYESTIYLQILTLAFIPSVIYLVTANLSNRLAGLLTGGLIVLREANAIHLSGEIPASHAKLLMSDLVTMLGTAAVVFLGVTILRRGGRNLGWFALLGASLGLTTLVRAQAFVILAPLLVAIVLSHRPLRVGLSRTIIVFVGLLLTLAPWLWRNWNLSGEFLLDDRTEIRLLARNFSADPTLFPERLPDESEQEFSDRLKENIFSYATTHPADVLFFIANHFFHNVVDSALFFAPIYSDDSPSNLLSRVPYWGPWRGELGWVGVSALFINLAVVALGIASAHQRHRLAGWLPLSVFLFYIGGNALARSSGWRFLLPVDWIILMYFCIGLAYYPAAIESLRGQKKQKDEGNNHPYLMPLIFGLLVTAGASIAIAEQLIPNQDFSNVTLETEEFLVEASALSHAQLDFFQQENDVAIMSGVALYPRYFQPNTRFSLADMPLGFNYLHFWLIGDTTGQIVLPLRDVPSGIPHTATVTVLGCRTENYISAWAVVIHAPTKRILIRDPHSALDCPLDEPN